MRSEPPARPVPPAETQAGGRFRLADWRAALRRAVAEMASDRMSLAAAGCAFYATLALFPAISMLVFLYGLAFDPRQAVPQLELLRPLLPPEAFVLISRQVHALVSRRAETLGIGLVISTSVTFWSASAGTRSLLAAMNLAYKQAERRGFLRFQLVAVAMTLSALFAAVLALAILVGLPTAVRLLGLEQWRGTLRGAGVAVLLVFVQTGLLALYRFGPAGHGRRVAVPGALVAAVLWVAVSELFSLYVTRVASLDVTYGPIGAVVGVMLWFYLTVYVILFGAELNASIARRLGRRQEPAGGAGS